MDSQGMDPNSLVFDLDQGFAQGFTQEQVNGELFVQLHKNCTATPLMFLIGLAKMSMFFFHRHEPAAESDPLSSCACCHVSGDTGGGIAYTIHADAP
jgi:hypothetical protein